MTERNSIRGTKTETDMPAGVEHTRKRRLFSPPADIYETNDTVVVVGDMPGVTPSTVDITLEKNVVTIRGTVHAHAPPGYTLSYAEYEASDYQSAFALSDEIDRDRISAKMTNGVLTLTLPKAKPSKKKISIATG